jgi:hypothetical protein
VQHRLGLGRVERGTLGIDALEALLAQRAVQRGEHRFDLGGAMGQGGVAGVEDRQQLLDEAAEGPHHGVLLPLLRLLAIVLEVGLGAPVRIEVLLTLG